MSDFRSDILSTAEAAELLGCSIATVTRLARAGYLPTLHKIPGPRGARVFHRDEVARVAAERALGIKEATA